MTWNFHGYYSNSQDGLISKLKLEGDQDKMLKSLRQKVRQRTRDIFEEAKTLSGESSKALSLESLTESVSKTRIRHLDNQEKIEVAKLIQSMTDEARKAFKSLNPRFWTQGSFRYDTLNQPFYTPPQEMDIDDGTYLPMAIFEDKPVIGHRLLLLLVDASLKSLAAENDGWTFEAQKKCARLKIPSHNTHIDVPMYAIPEKQFLEKEAALATLNKAMDSLEAAMESHRQGRANYTLNEGCVNLAVREGEQRWIKSDPKIVDDWFNDCCERIGPHLRKICRFMKSWRDFQWKDGGGPSSIALMAATVSILEKHPHDKGDLGATMRMLVQHFPGEFSQGVESPDHTDDKPLFPPQNEHKARELAIMDKLREFNRILEEAEGCPTRELALAAINKAYGNRVNKSELIIGASSLPAFKVEPSRGSQPASISSTMASG